MKHDTNPVAHFAAYAFNWTKVELKPDAAYYANWLSIIYGLKDRLLKNLLVFSPKIEDLTFLTLVCLQTKGKRE